ncbi:hypothetical protein [Pyxidicoccus fallax]|uniref:hypothetical protein n=1 Tax=Pyxidicoccus fallax TaxID=394095 RepID=UPI001B7D49B4|nr:hypothetical protein [Pyxidicoccus fallax]
MPSWRLILLSLLLCTTWLGCSDDPDPTPDSGTTVDSGTGPVDAGSDAGTDPIDSGTDAGTDPADSGSDAGTDPVDAGSDAGSDPTDGGADGGSDAGTDAGPPDDTVRIRRFTRFLTASGYTEQPDDFSQTSIELFAVDGGELVPVPGTSPAPGEYVFPGIPQGTYHLRVDTFHVVTDARFLDLSVNRLGRSDTRFLEYGERWLANLALGGLEPWRQDESDIQVVSGEVDYASELGLFTPEEGATSVELEQLIIGNDPGPMPVFEQSRGDRAWVMQMSPRQLSASDGSEYSYTTTVRSLHLAPFSYDNTAPMPLAGTLQPLPLNELSLDWRIPDFAALAAEVHPAATFRAASFSLHPAAHGPPEGWVGWSGTLLSFRPEMEATSPIQGTLLYGNPFPSTWGVTGQARASFQMRYQLPDDKSLTVTGSAFVDDRVADLTGRPLTPRVRPPRALTVDGTDAYGPRTLSHGNHVVAWEPPAAGSVSAYLVHMRQVIALTEDFLAAPTVALFTLSANTHSLLLPGNLLDPGQHYFLMVEAIHAPGYDVVDRPLMLFDRANVSRVPAFTGLLSVPALGP